MDLRLKQRAVIEFLSAEGCSATAIHFRMKAVYGNSCVDRSTVARWAKTLKDLDPCESSVLDHPRSGRPLSASDPEHQTQVDELIRSNRRIKQKDISNKVGISQDRVHHILTNLLQYRRVCARWVPRMLTPEMKHQRKVMCEQLLARYEDEGDAFIQQIVTGDESWVHHYDPESKQQSMEYRHKTSPSPKKFKVVASARKVMLTVFWDYEGIVHMEFLEKGETINSARYVQTLIKLKARLRRIRKEKDVIIHHDNARPHTSRETLAAIDRMGFKTLQHPSYSPDLAPSDFFLFPKLKDFLKGNRYESDDEVMDAVRSWCRGKSADFYADGLRQMIGRWRLCVERNGDYVEK